jgi:hypothetical protein
LIPWCDEFVRARVFDAESRSGLSLFFIRSSHGDPGRFLQFFIISNRKFQSGVVDTPVLRVLPPVSSPYGGDTKKLSIYPARVRMEESQDRVRVHSSVSRR